MRIFWQYRPQAGWLAPWKVTLVGDDRTGLSRTEIEKILKHCPRYHFLIIEIAIDFDPVMGIDKNFVRKHGVFGKSRRHA